MLTSWLKLSQIDDYCRLRRIIEINYDITMEIPPSHVVYHIPSRGNGTYTEVTLADRLLLHGMGAPCRSESWG